MDEDLLRMLLDSGLSISDVYDMVKQGISGKIPAPVETLPGDFLMPSHQTRLKDTLAQLKKNVKETKDEVFADFEKNCEYYIQKLDRYSKTWFEKDFKSKNWHGLYDSILEKIKAKKEATLNKLFGLQMNQINDSIEAKEQLKKFGRRLTNQITCAAYTVVDVALQKEKAARGVITFDDMILQLAEALRREEDEHGMAIHPESLRSRLRAKFDAVFIDEFQDTDKEQYYIFHRIFGMEKILFYIGDPKQSFYGWRKADIFTYFKAAENVDHVHKMNINRRSNAAMIEAMNVFFKPRPETDTFAYNGSTDAIEYVNVESPVPNAKGILYHGESPCVPLRISPFGNKKQLRKGFLLIVTDLLRDPAYRILEDGKFRAVEPKDIGILVRTNKEGRAVKEMLSRQRVPAVTIDDSKLFDSDEARELFYVMEAVNDITRANINRALLTRIGGYDIERLRKADEEAILQQFREYKASWETDGVFVMLRRFLADHGVEDLFADPGLPNPERTVSNILQLTEIIHKVSERRKYDAREQLQWLKKGIDGEIRDGDEFQQRIESDEAAVRIVTIHKSKGLEYNIVIAPHLDFVTKQTNYKTISYRDPKDSLYYTIETDLSSDDQKLIGENRRSRRIEGCFMSRLPARAWPVSSRHQQRVIIRHPRCDISGTNWRKWTQLLLS
jgi:exodeoxyribonuclease V beta subunit